MLYDKTMIRLLNIFIYTLKIKRYVFKDKISKDKIIFYKFYSVCILDIFRINSVKVTTFIFVLNVYKEIY